MAWSLNGSEAAIKWRLVILFEGDGNLNEPLGFRFDLLLLKNRRDDEFTAYSFMFSSSSLKFV